MALVAIGPVTAIASAKRYRRTAIGAQDVLFTTTSSQRNRKGFEMRIVDS